MPKKKKQEKKQASAAPNSIGQELAAHGASLTKTLLALVLLAIWVMAVVAKCQPGGDGERSNDADPEGAVETDSFFHYLPPGAPNDSPLTLRAYQHCVRKDYRKPCSRYGVKGYEIRYNNARQSIGPAGLQGQIVDFRFMGSKRILILLSGGGLHLFDTRQAATAKHGFSTIIDAATLAGWIAVDQAGKRKLRGPNPVSLPSRPAAPRYSPPDFHPDRSVHMLRADPSLLIFTLQSSGDGALMALGSLPRNCLNAQGEALLFDQADRLAPQDVQQRPVSGSHTLARGYIEKVVPSTVFEAISADRGDGKRFVSLTQAVRTGHAVASGVCIKGLTPAEQRAFRAAQPG